MGIPLVSASALPSPSSGTPTQSGDSDASAFASVLSAQTNQSPSNDSGNGQLTGTLPPTQAAQPLQVSVPALSPAPLPDEPIDLALTLESLLAPLDQANPSTTVQANSVESADPARPTEAALGDPAQLLSTRFAQKEGQDKRVLIQDSATELDETNRIKFSTSETAPLQDLPSNLTLTSSARKKDQQSEADDIAPPLETLVPALAQSIPLPPVSNTVKIPDASSASGSLSAVSAQSLLSDKNLKQAPSTTDRNIGRVENRNDEPAKSAAQAISSISNTDSPLANIEDNAQNEGKFASALAAFSRSQGMQSSEHMTNRSEAATELAVKEPIGDQKWAGQFSDKVVWMGKNELSSAEISINPPELGPIQITLKLDGDQATAAFASPHAEVRQSIESALPQLREMLSGSGISLGEANVGAQLPQRQQENAPSFANGNRSTSETAILRGDAEVLASSRVQPLSRGRGLVDLFA